MADELTADDFLPFVDTAFQVTGYPQQLVLVSVETRVPAGWEHAARQPFSLLLRGPRGDVVPEGMHHITANAARAFDLYLVPVQTRSPDCQEYQIVFN